MDTKTVDPENAAALDDLGVALGEQGNLDEAIEQFREADALWAKASSADRKFALYNWGDALLGMKLYEDAAQKYREAIQVDPEYADAYHRLGRALAAQERFDEAIEPYRRASELWAGSADRKFALYNWGNALLGKKLYEDAAQKYREAIQVDPEYAVAYHRLGRALAAQERFDEAIEPYRRASELWAGSADRKFALDNWGDALLGKKLYEDAAQKYREAIQVDPEYAVAYNDLGGALAAQERFDEAIEPYRRASELWAGSIDRKFALYNWGDALLGKKLYEDAAQKYREAIQVDPEYAVAYHRLGRALAAQERFDEAIEPYRRASELWAGSADRKFALDNWGDALLGKKLYEDAAQKYREAIQVDPEYAVAYNDLGGALAAQERFDEAIEPYRRANELLAGSIDRKFVLDNWGEALLGKKLYEDAAQKYREAIQVDPEYADAYNDLGRAYAAQERFDEAIKQYKEAHALWEKANSPDRKIALWNWGGALLEQECFDDAVAKYADAVKAAPKDAMGFFYYGNGLAACWRYREAIAQFEHATLLSPEHPYHHNNKAHFLFRLGLYEDGWKEWRTTRDCFESVLREKPRSGEDLDNALYFADVLRGVFSEYEESERYYQRVIEARNGDAGAWTGLAILYQQWANNEGAPPEIRTRLSYVIHRASQLLHDRLGQSGQFQSLLSLADLQIEVRDWAEARDSLELAEAFCRGSRLKRAEVATRRGLACYGSQEHANAIKHFHQALEVNPGDLTLRTSLGKALLRSKQFSAARDEFAQVLKSAPGHIDALLGAAEVCIELADDGDRDHYRIAEHHLTGALHHGRNRESGSKRLRAGEIADIYYLRGYAQTKRVEAEGPRTAPLVLLGALSDFRRCKVENPGNPKAGEAIEKIIKRLRSGASEALAGIFGPLVVFAAGAFVFLFAQLDFFFRETGVRSLFWLPQKSSVTDAKVYIAMTFGALLFMIAGLYLPNLRKLKVPGIELEKASVDRVSAPSTLDISRSGSLTR